MRADVTAEGNVQFRDDQGIVRISQMTPDQVLHIAKQSAMAAGYVPDDYKAELQFTPQHTDHQWTVSFQRHAPTPPGVHFLVWVNDETGKAQLMRGQ